MMALNLPACSTWRQRSYISVQFTRAVNRRSCEDKSQFGGAFLLRRANQHNRTFALQARRPGRSERQRRPWTKSSAALEERGEGAFPTPEALNESNTYSSTTQAAVEQLRPRQRGGGRGGRLQWFLGPLALLVTGALPALWLPSPSLFSGSATAGLLALTGLDVTFNMGATAFLLMADSSAKGTLGNDPDSTLFHSNIPLAYKIWSFLVNLVGLVAPIALVVASFRGALDLHPTVQILPAAALLGPYTLLLGVQWVADALVWQWQSPVWPVLPLVYQAYRLLQLTRGVELGAALDAPPWLVEAVKGLVAWWVFVLGMQIMWVAWLVGTIQTHHATK